MGAGVIGLTTAISLAEAGLSTRVVSAEPPSTSAAAGAIWGPVLCGPPDRCREWARTGLAVFSDLAGALPAAVRQVSGRELSRRPAAPEEWLSLLPSLRLLGAGELPDGFTSGWAFTAPVVAMPRYLEYLLGRYATAGGTVTHEVVRSLGSVDAPVVVNCTGVGARSLVPDPAVLPVRGQVVVVSNPGIGEFYIDHELRGADYVYVFPHDDHVILGGTAEHGATDWPARPAVSARILADCAVVFPALRDATVLAERVGLRPYRPEVRLEAEPLPGGRVLWHNYGHGGAGVTLSWGCAREITTAVLAGQPRSLPVPVSCRHGGPRGRRGGSRGCRRRRCSRAPGETGRGSRYGRRTPRRG